MNNVLFAQPNTFGCSSDRHTHTDKQESYYLWQGAGGRAGGIFAAFIPLRAEEALGGRLESEEKLPFFVTMTSPRCGLSHKKHT